MPRWMPLPKWLSLARSASRVSPRSWMVRRSRSKPDGVLDVPDLVCVIDNGLRILEAPPEVTKHCGNSRCRPGCPKPLSANVASNVALVLVGTKGAMTQEPKPWVAKEGLEDELGHEGGVRK